MKIVRVRIQAVPRRCIGTISNMLSACFRTGLSELRYPIVLPVEVIRLQWVYHGDLTVGIFALGAPSKCFRCPGLDESPGGEARVDRHGALRRPYSPG